MSPTSSRIGIAQLQRLEILGIVQLQDREIGARIPQQDGRLDLALVGKGDAHLAHALDDMVVGDDEPGRIDHDAGAERALHSLLRHTKAAIPKEAPEEGIVHERVLRPTLHPRTIDIDDAASALAHDRREGQGQLLARLRHHGRSRQRRQGERRKQRSQGKIGLALHLASPLRQARLKRER